MVVRAPEGGSIARHIERTVRRIIGDRPVVLAVSGGRDSMALLHAAARTSRDRIACVATFDHGTGPAATRAAELVADVATRLRFPVVVGRACRVGESEAEWRAARHQFLNDVAGRVGAVVATAHTRDDQLETVVMRVLRHAGARGLAGLFAGRDGYCRPLLEFTRDEIAGYAKHVDAIWLDDPMNASMRFLRNRVRHDLLPAMEAASPGIGGRLLRLSHDAARVRARVDRLAASLSRVRDDSIVVDARALAQLEERQLLTLWPAIAARIGLAMDRRGTRRAAAFTTSARVGSCIQLAGAWDLWRRRDDFELRRHRILTPAPRELDARGVRFDGWEFVATRPPVRVSNEWIAQLPVDRRLTVRAWTAGDRMRWGAHGTRKVKRFLNDARISGTRREQWPVVLAGDEIVWIPGVRRSAAAAVRPGRPGMLYRCELDDR